MIVFNAQIISCSGYESNACENTQEGGGNFYDVINLFQQNAVEIMTDNLFSFSSGKNGSIPSCPIDAVGKVVVSLIIRSFVLPLHLCLLLQISGSFFIPHSEHIMASILADGGSYPDFDLTTMLTYFRSTRPHCGISSFR